MSGVRSPSSAPRPALEALLAGASGDPLRRALMLDALDLRLRPCLSPPLAAHARLANISGHKLVFLVDSPVWHARLRLAEPELLHAARSLGLDVSTLVVRTASAPLQAPGPAERPVVPMSKAASDALQAALDSLREAPGESTSPGRSRRREPGPGAE
jgi:hypothetical protein